MRYKLLWTVLALKFQRVFSLDNEHLLHYYYSNTNWTFIALNLQLMKGDSKMQQHQDSQPISASRDRK